MDFEPKIIEYYNETPECFKTIEKMNNEYDELEKSTIIASSENSRLKKELNFYKSAFKWPYSNSVIYNLVRVTKGGEDMWIDRIKISEMELRELDQSEKAKYLLKNCNPRCER